MKCMLIIVKRDNRAGSWISILVMQSVLKKCSLKMPELVNDCVDALVWGTLAHLCKLSEN